MARTNSVMSRAEFLGLLKLEVNQCFTISDDSNYVYKLDENLDIWSKFIIGNHWEKTSHNALLLLGKDIEPIIDYKLTQQDKDYLNKLSPKITHIGRFFDTDKIYVVELDVLKPMPIIEHLFTNIFGRVSVKDLRKSL